MHIARLIGVGVDSDYIVHLFIFFFYYLNKTTATFLVVLPRTVDLIGGVAWLKL